MVVHNPPHAVPLLEDKSEQAARRFAVGHLELPLPANKRRFRTKNVNLQVAKRERAHLLPRSLISLPIPLQRRLPATGDRGSGKECQIRGVPIALHVAFKIFAVPRSRLSRKYLPDRLF